MKPERLIFAIGNPGREDDGLGFEFVNRLSCSNHHDLHHAYQLNIEDAELFSQYKEVFLVDAAKNCEGEFSLDLVVAESEVNFSTH